MFDSFDIWSLVGPSGKARDRDRRPVVDAEVEIFLCGESFGHARTNASGEVAFGAFHSPWRLYRSVPVAARAILGDDVLLASGRGIVSWPIAASIGRWLSARVEEKGVAVASAEVALYRRFEYGRCELIFRRRTDDEGRVAFGYLPDDTYLLVAVGRPGTRASLRHDLGASSTECLLSLEAGRDVTLHVLDLEGRPLAAAPILAIDLSDRNQGVPRESDGTYPLVRPLVVTDEEGRAVLRGVACEDEIVVRVGHAGRSTMDVTAIIPAGTTSMTLNVDANRRPTSEEHQERRQELYARSRDGGADPSFETCITHVSGLLRDGRHRPVADTMVECFLGGERVDTLRSDENGAVCPFHMPAYRGIHRGIPAAVRAVLGQDIVVASDRRFVTLPESASPGRTLTASVVEKGAAVSGAVAALHRSFPDGHCEIVLRATADEHGQVDFGPMPFGRYVLAAHGGPLTRGVLEFEFGAEFPEPVIDLGVGRDISVEVIDADGHSLPRVPLLVVDRRPGPRNGLHEPFGSYPMAMPLVLTDESGCAILRGIGTSDDIAFRVGVDILTTADVVELAPCECSSVQVRLDERRQLQGGMPNWPEFSASEMPRSWRASDERARDPEYRIRVRVIDVDGVGLAGLAAELEIERTSQRLRGTTNAEGVVPFTDIVRRLARLEVKGDGQPDGSSLFSSEIDLSSFNDEIRIVVTRTQRVRIDTLIEGVPGVPSDMSVQCDGGLLESLEIDTVAARILVDVRFRENLAERVIRVVAEDYDGAAVVVPRSADSPEHVHAAIADLIPVGEVHVRVRPPADGIFAVDVERPEDGQWTPETEMFTPPERGEPGQVEFEFGDLCAGLIRAVDPDSGVRSATQVNSGPSPWPVVHLDLSSVRAVRFRLRLPSGYDSRIEKVIASGRDLEFVRNLVLDEEDVDVDVTPDAVCLTLRLPRDRDIFVDVDDPELAFATGPTPFLLSPDHEDDLDLQLVRSPLAFFELEGYEIEEWYRARPRVVLDGPTGIITTYACFNDAKTIYFGRFAPGSNRVWIDLGNACPLKLDAVTLVSGCNEYGKLTPLPGATIEFTLRSDAGPIDHNVQLRAVQMEGPSAFRSRRDRLVEVGHPLVLNGLAPGRWQIQATGDRTDEHVTEIEIVDAAHYTVDF